MNQSSTVFQFIGYSFGFTLAASFFAFLIGPLLFGYDFENWTDIQGGLIGAVCTIAAFFGGTIGMKMAKRVNKR